MIFKGKAAGLAKQARHCQVQPGIIPDQQQEKGGQRIYGVAYPYLSMQRFAYKVDNMNAWGNFAFFT